MKMNEGQMEMNAGPVKIKCLIVDDEPLACKGMAEYVRAVDFLELSAICSNAVKASSLVATGEIQLIFLDIEMPQLSGTDFLRSLKNPPAVIFTTAYPKYALEGYELDVIDYLVKPIAFHRFLKAVNKAKDFLAVRQMKGLDVSPADAKGYLFLKLNHKLEKICYENILFIEALQNYVAIYLTDKKVISYNTLSNIEKQLPPELFMRVHKSYLVALQKIDALEGNAITINTYRIPISRTIKEQLLLRVVEKRLLKR